MKDNDEFSRLLEKAAAFHGHLCVGQVIGVRLAMHGLRLLGITDPLGQDRKKQIVFVEIDRCAADAIMTVTGCRVGRRSMKIIDNGKMAATFYHLETGKAVRIAARPDAREKVKIPAGGDEKKAQMETYAKMADSDLFTVDKVTVSINPEDLPGLPTGKTSCARCGEVVLDQREVRHGGESLCRPCAAGSSYYTVLPPNEHSTRARIPI
ncbi:MAG: FmdE family protein [Desulfopila sp.]